MGQGGGIDDDAAGDETVALDGEEAGADVTGAWPEDGEREAVLGLETGDWLDGTCDDVTADDDPKLESIVILALGDMAPVLPKLRVAEGRILIDVKLIPSPGELEVPELGDLVENEVDAGGAVLGDTVAWEVEEAWLLIRADDDNIGTDAVFEIVPDGASPPEDPLDRGIPELDENNTALDGGDIELCGSDAELNEGGAKLDEGNTEFKTPLDAMFAEAEFVLAGMPGMELELGRLADVPVNRPVKEIGELEIGAEDETIALDALEVSTLGAEYELADTAA